MKLGIIGTGSQLGNELSKFLYSKDIEVVSIGRSHSDFCNSTYFFDLELSTSLDEIFMQKIDTLILLSWIQFPRTKKSMEKNLRAYTKIIELAHLKGVKIIYISTNRENKY